MRRKSPLLSHTQIQKAARAPVERRGAEPEPHTIPPASALHSADCECGAHVGRSELTAAAERELFEDLPIQPKVAFKKDAGKLPMELIPTSTLRALAEVLAFGAKKYSPNGWRNVAVSDPAEAKWSRLAGAILRHYTEWMEGKKDPDTGLSPLKHLLCDVAFLIEFEERDLGTDDRWTKP